MARVLHGIEKGIRLYGENSDSSFVDKLFGTAAPGGDSGEQDAAPIGSIYQRTDVGGGLYKKITSTNSTSDWIEVGDASSVELSAGYTAVNGTVAGGDTVEEAISKLDANQQDLITLSGVAQGAVDLGTFTGDIIPDNSDVKEALQALETELVDTRDNVDDLITLSGVAENAADLGTFTGSVIPDNSTVKAALQSLETAVQSGITYEADGVTAQTVIDSLLVDSFAAVKWYIYVREAANPSRVKAFEIWATHNGTPSADATQVDDTAYAKLKIGSDFNLTLSVSLDGTGAAQVIRLTAASTTAGVDVRATRDAVSF